MRGIALLAALIALPAFSQGARFAFHPLEVAELTADQKEQLRARFSVMLARVPEIRLAGDFQVEEALARKEGRGCETHDACLQFLARATESLYGVYLRVRPDGSGVHLLLSGRVVRADGALVRQVSIAVPSAGGILESGTTLLLRAVEELELNTLADSIRVTSLLPASTVMDGQLLQSDPSPRRHVGYTLLGVGAAALAAGGILAGVALVGGSQLNTDASGAVPADQVAEASRVSSQTQAAAVMIPVGALITLAGALLGFWPSAPAPNGAIATSGSSR